MKTFLPPIITIRLCRLPVAFVTACSALTGYILAPDRSLPGAITLALAAFLLAAGASALNQYQDRHFDALMKRTRQRPLPSGRISGSAALLLAVTLIMTGLLLLSLSGTTVPVLLGVLALAWYNGLYTLLKRITAFAAIPGAVVGMLPPAIGWTAAQGPLSDPGLWALCFLFFMWQVPHFWLQLLDYGREYQQAGLPSLCSVFSKEQITRMTFVWIFAAAISGLFLPLYGTVHSPGIYFLLIPIAGVLIVTGSRLLISSTRARVHFAFKTINAYILIVMSLLSIEGLFLRVP